MGERPKPDRLRGGAYRRGSCFLPLTSQAAAGSPRLLVSACPLRVVVRVEDVVLGHGPHAEVVQQPEELCAMVGAVVGDMEQHLPTAPQWFSLDLVDAPLVPAGVL